MRLAGADASLIVIIGDKAIIFERCWKSLPRIVQPLSPISQPSVFQLLSEKPQSLILNLDMLHIALWEPEIPPNTGNIARLCAAAGATLHLIGRLGFRLDDKSLRRAGVDYWPLVEWCRHATLKEFETALGDTRVFCFSAHAKIPYTQVNYQDGDCLLFGGESHGLPESLLKRNPERTIGIPMPGGKVRSLNLATAVGIAMYEALRQIHRW